LAYIGQTKGGFTTGNGRSQIRNAWRKWINPRKRRISLITTCLSDCVGGTFGSKSSEGALARQRKSPVLQVTGLKKKKKKAQIWVLWV